MAKRETTMQIIDGGEWKQLRPRNKEMAILAAVVAQNGAILAANERLIKILSASLLFVAYRVTDGSKGGDNGEA